MNLQDLIKSPAASFRPVECAVLRRTQAVNITAYKDGKKHYVGEGTTTAWLCLLRSQDGRIYYNFFFNLSQPPTLEQLDKWFIEGIGEGWMRMPEIQPVTIL